MEFLYWLESIRHPVLDTVMLVLTEFGNDLLFIALGMFLLWCVDKRQGYFVLLTGFFGIYINQFLKITFCVPRPWVLDPNFTIVEAARESASGYSFPSGHTQIAVGCYGGLALCRRERWIRISCITLAVLIPLTRMYLGVHTPWDVGASILIALGLVFALWPLFRRYGLDGRLMYPLMGILTAMGIGLLLYLVLGPFPIDRDFITDMDVAQYKDALENAFKFLGCTLGMWTIYEVDRRFIRFETRTARWWAQLLKLVLGFALLLAVMEGTKPILNHLFGNVLIAHTVRYFLTVVFAGCLWPLTFRWFAHLGERRG